MPLTVGAARPVLLLIIVLVLAGGCSSPPKPTIMAANLDASPSLNPDSRGRASPVVLRIFELKSVAAFNRSDFFSLWDNESETLGAELVARDEFLMRPSQQKQFERQLQPDTRHIAVIAAFRDLEHSTWRGAIEVVPNQTQPITIKLDADGISILGR